MTEFLTGKSTYLRSFELEDAEHFWQWFADRAVVRYSMSAWQMPTSKLETSEWLERTIRDKITLTLGIVERERNCLIGYAGITGISAINRAGEYFILIGDKTVWGKGHGTEVTRMIVDYGFASLNLNRIMLTVSDLNIGGVKAYSKAGFKTEGVLRQTCFRDGAYHDKVVMAVLREEWAVNRGLKG